MAFNKGYLSSSCFWEGAHGKWEAWTKLKEWYGRSGLRAERTGRWVLRRIGVLIKTSKIVVDWIVKTSAASLCHTLERITLPAPMTPGLSMKYEWEWSVLLFSSFFLLPPLPSLPLSEGERGGGAEKEGERNSSGLCAECLAPTWG